MSDRSSTTGAGIGSVSVGPLGAVVLLGAAPFFPALKDLCLGLGIDCRVITAPDQATSLPPGCADLVVGKITDPQVAALLDSLAPSPQRLFLSFGARWILKERQIREVLQGPVLNAHGARLPHDRGGGGLTWRIMRGDRIGCLLMHLVDGGIDTGQCVIYEPYVIPRSVRTLEEHRNDYRVRLHHRVEALIDDLAANAVTFPLVSQPEALSSYYPRFNTELQGWIDWSWSPDEIERFILSLDAPELGARTLWRDTTIVLRDVQLHYGELPHHPYQAGLVIRTASDHLVVASSSGACLLVSAVQDSEGRDVLSLIKPGDRLATPLPLLEEARNIRVKYGANGLAIKET